MADTNNTILRPTPWLELESIALHMRGLAQIIGHMVETANRVEPEVFGYLSQQIDAFAAEVQGVADACHSA